MCTNCRIATTFVNDNQLPRPLRGEHFKPNNAPADARSIIELYDQARRALSQGAPSCAVLSFRKLLMHLAVQQGASPKQTFAVYVEYLKTSGVVGKPQYQILDRIRKAGNLENHEIVLASEDDANDLLTLITLLVKSIYFAG